MNKLWSLPQRAYETRRRQKTKENILTARLSTF